MSNCCFIHNRKNDSWECMSEYAENENFKWINADSANDDTDTEVKVMACVCPRHDCSCSLDNNCCELSELEFVLMVKKDLFNRKKKHLSFSVIPEPAGSAELSGLRGKKFDITIDPVIGMDGENCIDFYKDKLNIYDIGSNVKLKVNVIRNEEKVPTNNWGLTSKGDISNFNIEGF